MIKVYKESDYTKTGKLKKHAKPVFYWPDEIDMEEVAEELKQAQLRDFTSPYLFTHINAYFMPYGQMRIVQEVRGIMCSPTRLLKLLTQKANCANCNSLQDDKDIYYLGDGVYTCPACINDRLSNANLGARFLESEEAKDIPEDRKESYRKAWGVETMPSKATDGEWDNHN